ncbi:hypothetical protein OIO90_003491 [Microbotryomycetes sp. JL221]|nr:hypothetical protein OIO90_003491 [Microbotryomycetes sp. JL221]
MSSHDRSNFERERDKLIAEIAENLAKCCSNVNQLNRNMDNVVEVGRGFDAVDDLWMQFQTVMANGVGPQDSARDQILPRELPQGTDETAMLPKYLAPGGGDVVALNATSTISSNAANQD